MHNNPNTTSSTGKRKPYTIYVDKRIYRRFEPIAERKFKNVSRALEAYMIAEIIKAEKTVGVNPR